MNRSAHILLISRDPTALSFIQSTLANRSYSFHVCLYDELEESWPADREIDLVILDSVPLQPIEFNALFLLRERLEAFAAPILVLVENQPPRLRRRLVEMGFREYLPVPFDRLDLQTRVANLLETGKASRTANSGTFSAGEESVLVELAAHFWQQLYSDAVISAPEMEKTLLQRLKEMLNLEMALLFQASSPMRLHLLALEPQHMLEGNWEVPVGDSPLLNQVLQANQSFFQPEAESEDPFLIDLVALFNLHLQGLRIVKIGLPDDTRLILFLIPSQGTELSTEQLHLARSMLKMYQLARWAWRGRQIEGQAASRSEEEIFSEVLRFALEGLPVGILLVDEEQKLRYANPTAREILALDKQASPGQPLQALLGEALARKWTETSGKQAGATGLELEFVNLRGEKILLQSLWNRFMHPETGKRYTVVALRDVTSPREVEEEKRRMERLASLGVMVSGIAHEIRNPLAGIKAIAQAFQDELSPQNHLHEYVRRIVRQVDRLDEMLRSLFSYARPPKPHARPSRLEHLLHDALEVLRDKIEHKHIRVVESIESQLPMVQVDPDQIHQVFINLLLNSIEAIEEDGEIRISILPATRDLSRFRRKPFYSSLSQKPFVEVVIQDNGCGIAPEHMDQIFNPFFSTKNFGTGLGLSIVYQLVKENHGYLYLESEPGKGTTCYLLLPAYVKVGTEKVEARSA